MYLVIDVLEIAIAFTPCKKESGHVTPCYLSSYVWDKPFGQHRTTDEHCSRTDPAVTLRQSSSTRKAIHTDILKSFNSIKITVLTLSW